MGPLDLIGADTVAVFGPPSLEDELVRVVRTTTKILTRDRFHTVYFAGGFPHAPIFQTAHGDAQIPGGTKGSIFIREAFTGHEAEFLRSIEGHEQPSVMIGDRLGNIAQVATSEETGVFQAVGHLARHHNRRRIAFLAGAEDSSDSNRRLAAFRTAVESFGLTFDPRLVVRGSLNTSSGRECVLELRRRSTRPCDGLVATNDLMALGALDGLRVVGLEVPKEVSVIGFGDALEASFSSPPLTTLRPSSEHHAQRVVDLLRTQMDRDREADPEDDSSWEPSAASLPMMIRKSCGCESPTATPGLRSHEWDIDETLRREISRQLRAQRRKIESFAATEQLVNSQNLYQVASALSELLRQLRYERLLVCLYSSNRRQLRAVFDSEGTTVVYHNQALRFPVEQVLPPGYLRRRPPSVLHVSPLELAGESLGYLAIQADFADALDACSQLDLPRLLSVALSRISLGTELVRLYDIERQFNRIRAPETAPAFQQSNHPSQGPLAPPRVIEEDSAKT